MEGLVEAATPAVMAHLLHGRRQRQQIASIGRYLRTVRPHNATFKRYVASSRRLVAELMNSGAKEPKTDYCRLARIVSAPPVEPAALLDAIGIESYFHFKRLSDAVNKGTPSVRQFRKVLRRSGLPQLADALTGT